MSERTEFLGQRAELEQERIKQEAGTEALRDALRKALNPVLPVVDLVPSEIAALAANLVSGLDKLKETTARLAKLRELLGA